jgi:hypothetical protein
MIESPSPESRLKAALRKHFHLILSSILTGDFVIVYLRYLPVPNPDILKTGIANVIYDVLGLEFNFFSENRCAAAWTFAHRSLSPAKSAVSVKSEVIQDVQG